MHDQNEADAPPSTEVEPEEQRPGDQPLPTPNDHPVIQDLVVADIEKRRELGVQRYGTPLQPFNGRNALQDLYEEVLDAANYLRQVIYEAEHGNYSAFQEVLRGQLLATTRERDELSWRLVRLQAAASRELADQVDAVLREHTDGNGVLDRYKARAAITEVVGRRITNMRETLKAHETALDTARKALKQLKTDCPQHGWDFEASGLTTLGRPRCDSCKQPHVVTQALKAIDELLAADKAPDDAQAGE